jgi:hypothetical protein
MAALRAVQSGDDVKPEQRKNIERALEQLKQLRRNPHASQNEMFCIVREITESLVRALLK